MTETYRVRIWRESRPDDYELELDEWPEPDEVVEVEEETPHVWQESPRWTSGSMALDIHPEDRSATLGVYTSESVRSPPGYENHVERAYWDGPMEAGLYFPEGEEYVPFGCGIWGRTMFFVSSEE